MNALTPHSAARSSKQHSAGHHGAGQASRPTMHPDRAAVAGHLKRMHGMVTSPGMADHPLTKSEGEQLRSGAEALTRAANTAS